VSEQGTTQLRPTAGRSPLRRLRYRGLISNILISNIIYSLTVHIVNEKFEREDFVLAAFSLGDVRHTGENLASKILIELNKHGLSTEQLVCMVRDDAKNMINTCSLLKVETLVVY
jgi:predicted nuclease with TOPRIM domain